MKFLICLNEKRENKSYMYIHKAKEGKMLVQNLRN